MHGADVSCATDSDGPADKLASGQSEAPGKILRPADPDARIGDDTNVSVYPRQKIMPRAGTNALLVMTVRNVERLREFSRTGTEPANIVQATPLLHERHAPPRFERTNQDQAAAFAAFNQEIQHPMNAVIEINVDRAGIIAFDEGACARAREGVAGFVVQRQIRFRLDDDAGAFFPDQLGTDEVARAIKRVALEKRTRQKRALRHSTARNKRAA